MKKFIRRRSSFCGFFVNLGKGRGLKGEERVLGFKN